MNVDLRWLGVDDVEAVRAASDLFDYEVRTDWARQFLDDASHHLCVAYESSTPAGFVSGVEMTHPDKGMEMFLYELGVAEDKRGLGIGKALVTALAELARERGCYGMWVLTDANNDAALGTYRAGGATESSAEVMLTWRFDPTHEKFTDNEGD